MGENTSIGELQFLKGKPRSATCIAYTPCSVLLLKKKDFEKIMLEFEEIQKFTRSLIATAFSFPEFFSHALLDNFILCFNEIHHRKGDVLG